MFPSNKARCPQVICRWLIFDLTISFLSIRPRSPLKIRMDIRDLWNHTQSPLQQAITNLTTTLGHKIVPQVQWPNVWEETKQAMPDPADFIPAMVTYTTAWYDQMNWRLENDAFADWTEQLLSALSQVSAGTEISLHIEVII